MSRFVHRPSAATVIACVALSVAVGGSTVADAAKSVSKKLRANSVTSRTVKNGSLTLLDFNKKQAAKLKGKAGATGRTGAAGAAGIQGPAGATAGYTKTEADAAFTGKTAKAADADKLDGIDSTALVQGGGTQTFTSLLQNAGDGDLLTPWSVRGVGTLQPGCDSLEAMHLRVGNDQLTTVRISYSYSASSGAAPTIGGRQITPGNTFDIPFTGDAAGLIQFTKTTGSGLSTVTSSGSVLFTAINSPAGDAGKCRWETQVQTS